MDKLATLELAAALAKIERNAKKGNRTTRFLDMSRSVRHFLEAKGCSVYYRYLWTTVVLGSCLDKNYRSFIPNEMLI